MPRRLVIALEDDTYFDGWVEDGFQWEYADDGVATLSATVTEAPELVDPVVPPASGTNQDLAQAAPPAPDLATPDQTVPTLPQLPDQTVPSVPSGTDQGLVEAAPVPPAGNPDLTPEVDQGTDQGLVEVENPDVDNGLIDGTVVDPPVEEVPNPDVDNGLVETENPNVDNGLVEVTPEPEPEVVDPWLYAVEQVNQPNRVVDFTAKKGLVLTEDQAIDEGFMFRCAEISTLDGVVRREFSKTFPPYAGELTCTLQDMYGDGIPANNETMMKTLTFAVSPRSAVADASSTTTARKSTKKK